MQLWINAILVDTDQGHGDRRPKQVGQFIISSLGSLVLAMELKNHRPILRGRLAQGDALHRNANPCFAA